VTGKGKGGKERKGQRGEKGTMEELLKLWGGTKGRWKERECEKGLTSRDLQCCQVKALHPSVSVIFTLTPLLGCPLSLLTLTLTLTPSLVLVLLRLEMRGEGEEIGDEERRGRREREG
jgi:hypothetical protein